MKSLRRAQKIYCNIEMKINKNSEEKQVTRRCPKRRKTPEMVRRGSIHQTQDAREDALDIRVR